MGETKTKYEKKLSDSWNKITKMDESSFEKILAKNEYINLFPESQFNFGLTDQNTIFGEQLKEMLKSMLIGLSKCDFEEFKDRCDITKSDHRNLMCLFICGYINSDTMPLNWLELDGTNRYTKKFMGEFLTATRYEYHDCDDNDYKKKWDEFKTENREQKLSSDLCFIRDTKVTKEDCVLDLWTAQSDCINYNIEVWPIFFTLSLQPTETMRCYGVTSNNGSYCFLYNLHDWANVTKKEEAEEYFIERPHTLYGICIDRLGIFKKTNDIHFISKLSTSIHAHSIFLYVHLLTLLRYSTIEKKELHFYVWCDTKKFKRFAKQYKEFIKKIFLLNGVSYENHKAYMSWVENFDKDEYHYVCTPSDTDSVEAFGRLADRYFKWMNDNNFSEPDWDNKFFPLPPSSLYKPHHDKLIRDKHEVEYEWVFRDPRLLALPDLLQTLNEKSKTAKSCKDVSIYRRVLHAMYSEKAPDTLPGIFESYDSFFQKLKKDMIVSLRTETNGKTGTIINSFEKMVKETIGDTFKTFESNRDEDIKIAMSSYFTGNYGYTLSDLAYKYVVKLEDDRLIVADSHDLQVLDDSNAKVDDNSTRATEATPSLATAASDESDSDEDFAKRDGEPGTPKTRWSRRKIQSDTLTRLIEHLERVHKRHAWEVGERRKRLGDFSALTTAQKEEHEKLEKEVEELKTLIEGLKKTLKEMEEEKKGVEENAAKLQEEIDILKGENNGAGVENQTLKDQIKTLEEEKKGMEENAADLQKEIDRLNGENNGVGVENQTLKDQIKALEDEKQDMEKNAAKLQEEIDSLKGEKADADAEKTRLQEENDTLKKEKEKLLDETTNIKKLKDTNDEEMNKQNEELQDKIKTLEAYKENIEQSLDEMTESKQRVDEQKKTEEEKVKKLEKQLEQAEQAIETTTDNFEKDFNQELKQYDKQMSEGMNDAITEEMRQMLRDGMKEITDGNEKSDNLKKFYEKIKTRPSDSERYTNSTLFLVLESMGGTWMTAVNDFNTNKELGNIVIEKIIYHLRQWDSIVNEKKTEGYRTSTHYFKKFVQAFGLVDQDKVGVGGGGEDDTDDRRGIVDALKKNEGFPMKPQPPANKSTVPKRVNLRRENERPPSPTQAWQEKDAAEAGPEDIEAGTSANQPSTPPSTGRARRTTYRRPSGAAGGTAQPAEENDS